jgi:Tfp pilus assembly protein PilW
MGVPLKCGVLFGRRKAHLRGMTIIELMVAFAAGMLITTAGAVAWVFVLRSFISAGNYADLDAKSRYAVDSMLRDIRGATRITGFQKTGTNNWLALTNSQTSAGITYTWDSASRNLVCSKTGEDDRVLLTECDSWDFDLYQRTPHPGGVYVFYPATNVSGAINTNTAKLINMTWKCSRTIVSRKMNTENVQTAQVVLRNKQ